MSVDVLDPAVRVTITEEAHLFEDVLRHGDFHSDFVVDAMLFNRSRHNDAVHTPLVEAEIDEFVNTYGLNQQVSDEEWYQLRPSRARRLWNWLTRKHTEEE